jgi:hypothetical protein
MHSTDQYHQPSPALCRVFPLDVISGETLRNALELIASLNVDMLVQQKENELTDMVNALGKSWDIYI